MAMRIYVRREFAADLIRRGCTTVLENEDGSQIWRRADGKHFRIPAPEQHGGYPDWMLDDLIEKHELPEEPERSH